MSEIVAGYIDGELTIHIGNASGDYDTLCGIDFNDPSIGHNGTCDVSRKAKINCLTCRNIWSVCRGYKAKDFEVPAR